MKLGIRLAWSGESKEYKDTGGEIIFIFLLAFIIVCMTLAAQFESLVHPLTVMLAVPLAGFGAFGLLWLVNLLSAGHVPALNISLFSQIGLVLLIGLVAITPFRPQNRCYWSMIES